MPFGATSLHEKDSLRVAICSEIMRCSRSATKRLSLCLSLLVCPDPYLQLCWPQQPWISPTSSGNVSTNAESCCKCRAMPQWPCRRPSTKPSGSLTSAASSSFSFSPSKPWLPPAPSTNDGNLPNLQSGRKSAPTHHPLDRTEWMHITT